MIDIHSHILPEVDDGARTMEEARAMAEVAIADGITQMVCTPHLFNGISNNPEGIEIVDRVNALQNAIGSGLKVIAGSEAHISHEIAEQAKSGRATRINRLNYMLVEFPTLTVPMGADDLFYRIQLAGVHPILVHPERNAEIQRHPSRVRRFVEQGVFIQVTAMSMTGEFGAEARACAESLLRHQCVHFLASDTHRAERRPPILSRGRDAAAVIIGAERARKLVYDNPLAVVSGEAINAEAPIPWKSSSSRSEKKSLFTRFFGR
jgi:protein-tyrosine phosphatase